MSGSYPQLRANTHVLGNDATTSAVTKTIFIIFEKFSGGAKFGNSGSASQILGVFSDRDEANQWATEYVKELEDDTKKKIYARADLGRENQESIFNDSYRFTEKKTDHNGCFNWKVHWNHTTRVWVLEDTIFENADDLAKPCALYRPEA